MIRILSDLHLGHPASRIQEVEKLAPLFEGCEQVVFAGDVWQERKTGHQDSDLMFEKLGEMVGMRATYLRGNHDPGTPQGLAWLNGKDVLVTHGDAVYRDATPWAREMPIFREEVKKIIARYDENDPQACSDRACEIAWVLKPQPFLKLPVPLNFFVSAFWPLTRPFEIFSAWKGLGDECHRFLERVAPETKVLICGHFHHAGIWEKSGRLVINTGSFMKCSKPRCVDIDGPEVIIREIIYSQEWKVGPVVGRWRIS